VSGLTLSAVARELQLTKAALYYCFDSKEALVAELVYLGLEGHAAIVGAAALEVLIRSASAHYGSRRDELRLAYLMPQFGAEMLARFRHSNERIYGSIAKRVGAGGLSSPYDEGTSREQQRPPEPHARLRSGGPATGR
jgi:AcrR family transcriptional regulator